jgi:hypothetical protein
MDRFWHVLAVFLQENDMFSQHRFFTLKSRNPARAETGNRLVINKLARLD